MTRVLAWLLVSVLALSAVTQAEEARLACAHITVYVREGCPHCREAKAWLGELQARLPRLGVGYRDVGDARARAEFEELVHSRHVRNPGVPTFSICDEVLVGFGGAQATGALIEGLVTGRIGSTREVLQAEVPWLGMLRPADLGLPLFTVLLGLVDGFNPCAMWVLLFLLGLLVHVKSRARILLVAGSFVLVSGAVYFAFMAAWLELFLVIGYSRVLQLALGLLALLIGAVHVKDFFALHRGFSLSIPEGLKPTLYQRVRAIVRAENWPAALGGAIVLAVLVNFVELLCTAGLPALFTQVLSHYALGSAQYYGYLLLYNLAYIADDSLMVAIAVVTLGQHRLQEREGRWLKLLSGTVIIALGAVLVIAPQWLSTW